MFAEKLRKFIDENKNPFGWEATLLLNGICNTLCDYEKLGKIEAIRPKIPKQNPLLQESCKLFSDCLDSVSNLNNFLIKDYVKAAEIMIDYIKHKERVNAISNIAELAKEYLKPKPENILFPEPSYKQHEEKLINADDFLNETPSIIEHNVGMLRKALREESGDSMSMDVLCYDDMAGLKKVTSVKQVLFTKEHIADDHYVIRIVKEAVAGEPKANIGLLIS